MVTKVLTNYARVLMFLEDLVSLPEDCGQNSAPDRARPPSRPAKNLFHRLKRPIWMHFLLHFEKVIFNSNYRGRLLP